MPAFLPNPAPPPCSPTPPTPSPTPPLPPQVCSLTTAVCLALYRAPGAAIPALAVAEGRRQLFYCFHSGDPREQPKIIKSRLDLTRKIAIVNRTVTDTASTTLLTMTLHALLYVNYR